MEIEAALKALPLKDAEAVAQWLQTYLDQKIGSSIAQDEELSAGKLQESCAAESSGRLKTKSATPMPVSLPDYAARRRMIFGDKVLPNMVMLAREQERW